MFRRAQGRNRRRLPWSSAMTRFLLAGLAAAVGLAGHPAAAADLVAGAPPAVNAPVPLPTWSGFYLGAGLGGRWADAEWTTTALGEGPTATVPLTTGNPASFDLSGSRISVFLGHNWQISNWVLGVEAYLGWGDTEERRIGIPGSLAAFGPNSGRHGFRKERVGCQPAGPCRLSGLAESSALRDRRPVLDPERGQRLVCRSVGACELVPIRLVSRYRGHREPQPVGIGDPRWLDGRWRPEMEAGPQLADARRVPLFRV